MNKNTFFAALFFFGVFFVAGWKYWAWLYWKILRLRKKEQVFDLLSKYRFIEITGASGKGKSWLLMHCFKQLEGVKFTNCPTPKSVFTLTKEELESHMIGKWAAPNKWFYFLDDINTFQQWSQKEFGANGYSALLDYISHAGKLGGTFIWTSNGANTEPIFSTNKNKTWKVLGYTTFLNKSLLWVGANDSWYNLIPTAIPLDNEEIIGFYDPHWNIPKETQKNWLAYLAEKNQMEELKGILQVIEESGEGLSKKDYDHNVYQKILRYVELREIEEKVVKEKSNKISKLKQQLKKYGSSDKKITPSDVTKWEKEKKSKQKRRFEQNKLEIVNEEEDLDQINQDSDLSTEDNSQEENEESSQIIEKNEPKKQWIKRKKSKKGKK